MPTSTQAQRCSPFHRTGRVPVMVLAGLAAGAVLVSIGAGLTGQPAGGAAAAPASPPPPPKFEYASLMHAVSLNIRTEGNTLIASDWHFCAPGEDLTTESSITGKYGGSTFGAQPEVAVVNGLADKGWEQTDYGITSTYEPKDHNGTTSVQTRIVVERWWFRRTRPVK